jgi:hypothetical protein
LACNIDHPVAQGDDPVDVEVGLATNGIERLPPLAREIAALLKELLRLRQLSAGIVCHRLSDHRDQLRANASESRQFVPVFTPLHVNLFQHFIERGLAAAKIKRLVDEAPPLSREDLQEIATLLKMRVVE